MAALPATPWLTPPDQSGAFLQGAHIGLQQSQLAQQAQQESARIGLAQQKLQQDAIQTQTQLEMTQQIKEQQALQEQQRIEITKQYHQQQTALAQQRIEETAKINAGKIQEAARQAQVKMRIQQRLSAKEDYQKVMMEEGPQLYTPQQMGPVIKQNAPAQTTTWTQPDPLTKAPGYFKTGDKVQVPSGQGPGAGTDKTLARMPLSNAYQSLRQQEKDYPATPAAERPAKMKEIMATKKRIDELTQEAGEKAPFPEAYGLPLPKTEKELEKGQLYQTKHGLATWDGEQFTTE